MILVDTSIWIDHFRRTDEMLVEFLRDGRVVLHPFILGEIALGRWQGRTEILLELRKLPLAIRVDDDELFALIERNGLHGSGIGYVDAHLLASARLATGLKLWTKDRKLTEQAERLGVCAHVAQ